MCIDVSPTILSILPGLHKDLFDEIGADNSQEAAVAVGVG